MHPSASVLRADTPSRVRPAGVEAGAPLTRIHGPLEALALVGDDLAAADQRLTVLVGSDVAEVPKIAGYLLEAGGKRLRPAITALGALALNVRPEGLVDLMCVGELIHLGSLLHDDVVDEGMTRRGRPTAHRVHGNAATVLTGDFCLARAVLLASQSGGHAAVTALADAVTRMAEGEVLQLRNAGNLRCGLDAYLDVIDRKSAALIAWCASAAAHVERPDAAEALATYGREVGVAFQITDDVLDYANDTGKPAGADLRQRKVTLPLLMAMEAQPAIRDELEAGPPSSERLPTLMRTIEATGALRGAREEARRRVERAIEALRGLPEGLGREALVALGRYLVERGR